VACQAPAASAVPDPGRAHLGSRASAAPHNAAAAAAYPVAAVGWVSAVTAPAAGSRVKPVTAHTTANRPAAVLAVIAAIPASAITSAIAAAITALSPR